MAQAPTVAIPQRFPLVVEPENRDETTLKDARLVNAYMERNARTGETWIFKRPGLLQTGATKAGVGRGVYNWLGDVYSIFGATLYKNETSIGTVDTTGGVYTFSSTLGVTPRMQLSNGVKMYNWNGSALTQVAGQNFPGNTYENALVKGVVYLDGGTYVMDEKSYIHGSDTLIAPPPTAPSGTTPSTWSIRLANTIAGEAGLVVGKGREPSWGGADGSYGNHPDYWTDSLNMIGAQMEPDAGVCLAKQLVYILAIKEWATEVFYNASNPTDSPLSPVQGAKINYGCVNADSVQEIDGMLLWLATNRSAATQVILVDKLNAKIISTRAVERLLGEADVSAMASFALKYEGHRFYGFTLKQENCTLVYDITENMWAQWTDEDGDYFPVVSVTYKTNTGLIVQHESNGKLYLFDAAYTTDDGAGITVDIYTPNFDGGVRRRKQLNMLEFIGDQTAGSTLEVRFNDHDYASKYWSNIRYVDMGMQKAHLMNCGTFQRRAIHIRHKCATRLRLQALEIQLDLGTL